MTDLSLIGVVLFSFAISLVTVWLLVRMGDRLGLLDEPNHRSLHQRSTPRSGGLGMLIAIICTWVAIQLLNTAIPAFVWFFVAFLAVAVVSLVDDLYDVSPLPRLSIHIFASAIPILGGFALTTISLPGVSLSLGLFWGAALTILFIGWFINLFNFMDGMDGFAGGMAMFGFGALAILGMLAGEQGFALATAAVAASAAGFLVFNFPPARIFMGDVGSAPLGFLVGGFSVWADTAGVAPLWVSVMIFSPFFLDATVTLFRRMFNRERIWEAHRSHYYQRSVQAGWTHRQTVLVEYGLMAGCALTAIFVVNANPVMQWAAVCLWLLVYALCALGVHMREHAIARGQLEDNSSA